jgi:hypothetical protein
LALPETAKTRATVADFQRALQSADIVHLASHASLLQDCSSLGSLQERMDCRANAWNSMKSDLERVLKIRN